MKKITLNIYIRNKNLYKKEKSKKWIVTLNINNIKLEFIN